MRKHQWPSLATIDRDNKVQHQSVSPGGRQRKGKPTASSPHPSEAIDQCNPGPSQGRQVDAVTRVVLEMIQVHACGFTEVIVGEVHVADFGRRTA